MPTYDYSGEITKLFDGEAVRAGERFTVDEYLSDDDVNLVSHLPQVEPPPIKTLFNDDIVAGVVRDVSVDQKYARVNVYNVCGGILKFYANGDADNYITMPSNSFWEVNNSLRNVGTLHLSGESSGNVQITCDQNI